MDELQAFYDAVFPRLEAGATYLQQFEMDALPVDAALELINSDPGKEFTVQDVVERSGQSLRSFYQYFAGKYELLLALFEESVRTTAEQLQEVIAEEEDPLERLRRFAIEYYRMCR